MGIQPGDTCRFDPTGGTNPHLWIVLAVYTPDWDYKPHAIIASVTDINTRFADRTCILTSKDSDRHPYVAKDSYVYYERMIEIEIGEVPAPTHPPCCTELITRVVQGAFDSEDAPQAIQRTLRKYLKK